MSADIERVARVLARIAATSLFPDSVDEMIDKIWRHYIPDATAAMRETRRIDAEAATEEARKAIWCPMKSAFNTAADWLKGRADADD